MPRMLVPPGEMKLLIRDRRRSGADRYDEVWNGVYAMSPLADVEHQFLVGQISTGILNSLGRRDAFVLPGANVSDRSVGWKKNYRCPDVAVLLPGCTAEIRESHIYGGPDFAVEVLSPGDRSRKKFDFYQRVGVRELLLVDRRSRRLELYAASPAGWNPPQFADVDSMTAVRSTVLELEFRLVSGRPFPQVLVGPLLPRN